MTLGNVEIVRRFADAGNRRDVAAFLATLHPDVELHTGQEVLHGHDGARRMVEHSYDHLALEVELQQVFESGDTVVGLGAMRFRWKETGDVAEENQVGAVWQLRDGKVVRWELHPDPDDALRAAGLDPSVAARD